ncbi:MAG: hypothetical protein JWQ23_2093 [Herminiimonas sp.]|nr:hypothetical protein [Herminiimonas sp.]
MAALVILGGLTWNLTVQSHKAAAHVTHTYQVITSINDVAARLFEAESHQRAYLLTGRGNYLEQRDSVVQLLDREVDHIAAMTLDNPAQQARIANLKQEIVARKERFRYFVTLYQTKGSEGIRNEFGNPVAGVGPTVLVRLRTVMDSIKAEEINLLQKRKDIESSHVDAARIAFISLFVLLAIVLPLVYLRVRTDILERRNAEELVRLAAIHDRSNAQALTLYNAETNRNSVLQGTLSILADNHSFPALLFYAYEEWGGALRLDAARGAPAGARTVIKLGEGMVGEVAQSLRTVEINNADEALAALPVDTGFGMVAPSAVLFCPVSYRGTLLGVMALASIGKLSDRDRSFTELVCTQLGAALHNIKQLEDMRLLAEQLRVRSEEITAKNREVEEASRMKSEFLANMSHELRTPLNAIIGFSEVIRDGMAGPVNAEQEEYTNDILSSGKHLLALINDILDLSKIESGHMTLDLDPVHAAELAESGFVIVKERALISRVALTRKVEPGLDKLCVDIRKARQIIYNLLSNAVKFTPEGGAVDFSIRRVGRAEVESHADEPGIRMFPLRDPDFAHFIEISVSDTGIGIAPDDLKRLFEPFTQIDSSLSRKYEGTGLGLAMVRRLAELHGGGAMVRSAAGVGSSFTVWLPWRDPLIEIAPLVIAPAPARATFEEETGRRSLTELPPLVLLVEDEPNAAKIFRMQLEKDSYRVVHATSAEAGLRMAAELQPDAVVLDIILPGMDGWEMLALLKQTPAISRIPVVIVSITNDASRGFALGASQVLSKPVSQDDLMTALAAIGINLAGGERVLVADDDPKAVSLISIHLKAAGFVPLGAYGGKEAIELAISKKPSLVVLDLMMPEISGFDVVQAMHSTPDTAEIPIIILTAKVLTAKDRARLDGRVQRVMEKSNFDPKLFDGEVKRALMARFRKARIE